MRHALSLSALIAGLMLVSGCGQPSPHVPALVGLSLVGPRPFGDVSPSRFGIQDILEPAIPMAPDPARWTAVGAGVRFDPTAILVNPTNLDPQVRIAMRFDAGSVCAIEVAFLAQVWEQIELFWALDDGKNEYDGSRRATWTPVAGAGVRNRVATFDMRRRPGWHGAIHALRVDPPAGVSSSISSIRLLPCASVGRAKAMAMSRQVWEVASKTTLRNAVLVADGVRHEWRTEAAPRDRLVFSAMRVDRATRFRLEVRIAGRSEPVLQSVIRPGLDW